MAAAINKFERKLLPRKSNSRKMNFEIKEIGKVCVENGLFGIKVEKQYSAALKGIADFGYLQVFWVFDKLSEADRSMLTEKKPYKKGPEELGVFATRTPNRPNPIAVSTVFVLDADYENGMLFIPYIDAFPGTPVIDIKPYIPSLDRVEAPSTPDWCSEWPDCIEKSGDFNWEEVFNF